MSYASDMTRQIIRMLFMPREPFPNDRVRINVLFGRELVGRGHEIDLAMQAADETVATGAQDWFGRTVSVGPTDSKDGFLHRARKHWLGFRHDLRSLSTAKRPRYEAILISDKFLIAAIAAVVCSRRGVKFIYWLTFPIPEMELTFARDKTARYPWLGRIRGVASGWLLYRWIMPRSDHVFVQSDRMKKNVCAHGIPPTKVSPILTGFDLTGILPVKPRDPNSVASTTLAYLGTLESSRHLEVLVDMLAQLRAAGMNARLLLIGDADKPQHRLLLERCAQELGMTQHVQLTGFLPQAEALCLIEASDICISPIFRSPILEVGSPTKLIEYMALGLPVIANDHPEQEEILRESRAGVCVPWGARHFARAVTWLMKRSRTERAAMGARGRAWVEANRTYARIADEVERTYFAMLGSRPNTTASTNS